MAFWQRAHVSVDNFVIVLDELLTPDHLVQHYSGHLVFVKVISIAWQMSWNEQNRDYIFLAVITIILEAMVEEL